MVGFAINGHDRVHGSEISLLCAAVSSAAYLTVNTLTDVAGVRPEVLEQADGLMTLRLRPEDARANQTLLRGFELHLRALSDDYKQQLDITITEV